jgi:hypothetical protein
MQSVSLLHDFGHPVDLQRYGLQSLTLGVLQVLVAMQVAGGVYRVEPAAQMALAQVEPVAVIAQAPAPSHFPVFPQVATVHWPVGADWPEAMFAQVPAPFRLQAWHVPQVAVEQQTPSTQLPGLPPLLHWFPAVQVAPSAFLSWQVPLVQ